MVKANPQTHVANPLLPLPSGKPSSAGVKGQGICGVAHIPIPPSHLTAALLWLALLGRLQRCGLEPKGDLPCADSEAR